MTKTFLRIDAVKRVTGMATSSIYEEMGKGKFPRQIPIGPNRVAWLEDEVMEWQRARIADRDNPEIQAAKAKRTARRLRAGVTA